MSDKPTPGPVRTLKDMSPAERAQMLANYKPPKPPPMLPFRCARREPSGQGEDEVELSAVRKVLEADGAVLYLIHRLDGGHTPDEVWLPKSVIVSVDGTPREDLEDGEWGDRGEPVSLVVKRWLAKREGLV